MSLRCDHCGRFVVALYDVYRPGCAWDGPDTEACERCHPDRVSGSDEEGSGDGK